MVFLDEALKSRTIIALIIILAGLYIARLGETHAGQ